MIRAVRKAVFPIAGLGTRFLPATKTVAKEMLPVVDKPLIQYAVEEALAAGIEQMIFVVGLRPSGAREHFLEIDILNRLLKEGGKKAALDAANACVLSPENLLLAQQTEPLGLGHAVACARHLVGDEPFAVLLPDDLVQADTPCLRQMIDARARLGGNMVAVMDVPRAETRRYGVLDVADENGDIVAVKGLVEKPEPDAAPSTLSIIGRYVLEPDIFHCIDRVKRGAGGEIQLTDAMALLIGNRPLHGYRFSGTRYDCGSRTGFLEANIAFALARPDMIDDARRILSRYRL